MARRDIVQLYLLVLRKQRTLPKDMQIVGFAYIQHEFREHRAKCPPGSAEWAQFMASWRAYLSLDLVGAQIGEQGMPGAVSSDQARRLELLESTIKGVR